MISSILEVLESSFMLSSHDDNNKPTLKTTAVDVASRLLILPTPPSVQMHTTALLAALHNTKQAYHLHKVFSNQQVVPQQLQKDLLYFLLASCSLGSRVVVTRTRVLEVDEGGQRPCGYRRREFLPARTYRSRHCRFSPVQSCQVRRAICE